VDPRYAGSVAPLLEVMVEYFDEENVNYVKYWNVYNLVTKYLAGVGFVSKPGRVNLTFRKDHITQEEFSALDASDASRTHFTLGDHDHI
jgi:hypothetical protein